MDTERANSPSPSSWVLTFVRMTMRTVGRPRANIHPPFTRVVITSVVNKGGHAVERIAEGEYAVMEVLWETAPLTAAEVADRVPAEKGWSLATVKTMLSRLLGKGLLAHEQDGRRYLYRPAVAREAYVAAESGRLIDRMFGGRLT